MTNSQNNSDGVPLTEKRRIAIANHINKDHLEDMLACVKVQAGTDWIKKVRVISIDAAGITLEVSGIDQVQPFRLDFPAPVQGALAFKQTVSIMISESRTKLGWE